MPRGITQSKPRPGAPRRAVTSGRSAVQRKKETSRAKKDWKALGRAWQADWKAWKKVKGDPFLESTEGQAFSHRSQIDDKLGVQAGATPAQIERRGQLREVDKIRLWASPLGGLLGRTRFALGDKFDAVADFFERVRNRFKNARENMKASRSGFGWRSKLFKLIATALKGMIGQFLAGLFDQFVSCINAVVNGVVRVFTRDIKESIEQGSSRR